MKSFNQFLLSRKRTAQAILGGLLALVASGSQPASAQVNVLTQHNDIARTGANLSETVLNPTNVNAARFGKLYERPVDSSIWGQPLIVNNVVIPGKGKKTIVYVQTEVGQVYAFDANDGKVTAPYWRRDLAPNDFSDSVSAPVIDTVNQTFYCVVRHMIKDNDGDPSNDNAWFTFHGLDLRTGLDKFPEVRIQGSVESNGGKGAVNGRLNFRSNTQRQRPALLNLNGVVYAAFGGGLFDYYEDLATWNGWIFGFDALTGAIKIVWATTPDRNGGGIWQGGGGMSSDGTNIFAVTANGSNNPLSNTSHQGGRDYGNSILKLMPNATKTGLTVSQFFTPYNYQYMEDGDQDLGASGSMLIPGTNLLMAGDKIGRGYVVNRDNLGGFTQGRNNIVQDLPAWKGHMHGGVVYYNSPTKGPMVYGWSEHDYMKAFKVLGNQGLSTTPVMKSNVQVPPGMPGGFLSVSAKGKTANTGIIWASTPLIGDANLGPVPGILHAFDANDLTKELWNSEIIKSRDTVGFFAKFSPPTVANGKVYLASFNDPKTFTGAKLLVYGPLTKVAVPAKLANLTAAAGLLRNSLTWGTSANATTYTLKRGTATKGPFTAIASNLRTISYEDTAVTGGTTYYYVVTAENAGGSSANSNVAKATPTSPINGQVISVNFLGGTRDFANNSGITVPMGANEVAGIVPVPNWNTLSNGSGTSTALRANGGAQTTAAINWNCEGIYATEIADAPGNNRMMKGYLSNANTSDTTVSFTNIPENFIKSGYDVYVYSDGFNPTSTRSGTYTVNGVTQTITDSQNRDFEGAFVSPGVANVGNYAVFTNLKTAQFTLKAARAAATDNLERCPVNGIQIVARSTVLGTPTNLVADAVNNGVWLNWNAVSGAASYRVIRSLKKGGPYTTVAEGITVPRWSDPSVLNGKTYFYVVNAIGSSGEVSPPSNEASAKPAAKMVGSVISIDLGGGSTAAMAPKDKAGADGVVQPYWNSAFFQSGGLGDLLDNKGKKTTLDVVWSNGVVGDMTIADKVGPFRMMRSYLAAPAGQALEVNLYNIPASFVQNGFDIYVYSDNNNGGSRTSKITSVSTNRGTAIINITDPADTNFSGTFVNANYSNGNYGRVMNVRDADVTLRFESVSSTDGISSGAVNGIQLVSRASSGATTMGIEGDDDEPTSPSAPKS